jgi:hypothetical protein
MPAKSKSQFRLMQAVAHNPKIAKKVGIPASTAAEYVQSNVGKKAYSKLPEAKAASYKEGGKSTVNEAGNYTKPELRKRIFNNVKSEATAGTGAGEWSARKAQVVAKRYKDAGGGYRD